ncbi:DNA repair protein RecO [Pseudoflavonifractor sp. 524-17]|uniref:DNA repair protein RecO n=1 Tax=Pseudoflavonifractor sp. 524-17 TaxID=2304577 RepID=UPI00137B1F15|nr:DNA repair protein RecO [Pseudoflavonifractor sp. 524-17]NCE64320.1 DNA repair protein RecO [Pseudoflavonifractor sp. 524-17]
MLITVQGIVLREVNYKESDKILTVLTREAGKLTVKARGCRRRGSRLAAAAQLLAYSEMTLFEYRDHCTMNEAEPLELFWGVRSDVEKVALGAYFAEVLETTSGEGQADPALVSLLLNALYALDKLNRPAALVKGVFELRLMALMGFEPLLEGCSVCGAPEPEEARLLLAEGVLVCGRCRPAAGEGRSMPAEGAVLRAMRRVLYGDPRRLFSFALGEDALRRFGQVCEGFLTAQLERGFHTLEFYKSLCLRT